MSESNSEAFKQYYYTDTQKARFYQLLGENSREFGCNYISYVYEQPETGVRFGFSTNPDWQAHYIGESLIDDCHLWKSVLSYFINTKRPAYIMPWDTVEPETEKQEKIIQCRDHFDIGRNGVSFCSQNTVTREFLAFAPSGDQQKFARHVVENIESVRNTAIAFRNATQEALEKMVRRNK